MQNSNPLANFKGIVPDAPESLQQSIPPQQTGNISTTKNPLTNFKGIVPDAPQAIQSVTQSTQPEVQASLLPDTFGNRSIAGLQRDWAEANMKAKQIIAGDVGGVQGAAEALMHPLTGVTYALEAQHPNIGQAGGTLGGTALNILGRYTGMTTSPTEAATSLAQGADLHKMQQAQNQINQMDNASGNVTFMAHPVQWMGQAISDHLLDSLGIFPLVLNPFSKVGAAIEAGKGLLPSLGAGASGLGETAAIGAVGVTGGTVANTLGQSLVHPITDPNNPNYYSRQNQVALTRVSSLADIGGLAAGGVAGLDSKIFGKLSEAFKPTTTEAKRQLKQAGVDASPGNINQILNEQTQQANTMLTTAKSLGLPTDNVPTDPTQFQAKDIEALQKTIAQSPIAQTYQSTVDNMQNGTRITDSQLADLNSVIASPDTSSQIKQSVQDLIQQAKQHNSKIAAYEYQQANKVQNAILSEDAPTSIKDFLKNDNAPYNAEQVQQQNTLTNASALDVMNTQYKALSPLYEALNNGISPESQSKLGEIIDSITRELSKNKDLAGYFGNGSLTLNYMMGALKSHDNISNPTFTLPRAQSFAAGLSEIINRSVPGSSEYSEPVKRAREMLATLAPVIKEVKQEAIQNYLVDKKGLTPEEANILYDKINSLYPDMAANRVTYKDRFRPKATAAEGNSIVPHPSMSTYHADIASNLDKVADWGNNVAKVHDAIVNTVQDPLYQKAFSNVENPITTDILNQSMLDMNNNMQKTFVNGIKAGITPQTLDASQVNQIQQTLNHAKAHIATNSQFLANRPDVAKVLIDNYGGQQIPATYESIKNKLLGNTAPQTISAVLDYLKRTPLEYSHVMEQVDSHFADKVADLIIKNDAATGSNVIRSANQLQNIFGKDADPILLKTMYNIGSGLAKATPDVKNTVISGLKRLINTIDSKEENVAETKRIQELGKILGFGSAKLPDTATSLQIYQQKMWNRAQKDTSFIPNINKLRVMRIALDAVSRFIQLGGGGLNKAKFDKAIGESLLSRANFDKAQRNIMIQENARRKQKIANVIGGAIAGYTLPK